MEYISKDDAAILIELINSKEYSLTDARKYISIVDRLKKYKTEPDVVQTFPVNGHSLPLDRIEAQIVLLQEKLEKEREKNNEKKVEQVVEPTPEPVVEEEQPPVEPVVEEPQTDILIVDKPEELK